MNKHKIAEILKLNKEDEEALDCLVRINKIAHNIKGYRDEKDTLVPYYTGFGLPIEYEEQVHKHKKEIIKMINTIKKNANQN